MWRRSLLDSSSRIAIVSALMAAAGACAADRPATSTGSAGADSLRAPNGQTLRPVVLPDLSKMTESVQRQIRAAHGAALASTTKSGTTSAELADTFGALGKILLRGEYRVAGAPCDLVAQELQLLGMGRIVGDQVRLRECEL